MLVRRRVVGCSARADFVLTCVFLPAKLLAALVHIRPRLFRSICLRGSTSGEFSNLISVWNGDVMKYQSWVLACVASSIVFAGCRPEVPTSTSATETGKSEGLIAPVLDLNSKPNQSEDVAATPEQVVTHFLQALCQGDADAVTQLLTDKARVETQKHQLVVQPPGTEAAKYQVGKVEFVKGGAYVNSLWIEPGADGMEQQYDIVWVLRSQSNGWRVAGMAARIDRDRELTYLNFEDPQEMLSKWEAVDTELAQDGQNPDSPRVTNRQQPDRSR